MILSMTGYGRGVANIGDLEVNIEVRSVNNRFLDTVIKTPRLFANNEQQMREVIAKYIKRGRVNLWLNVSSDSDKYQDLVINKSLVGVYAKIAKELNELGIQGTLQVENIISMPEILVTDNEEQADEETWEFIEKAIIDALTEMNKMRAAEGNELFKDFINRVNNLEALLIKVEALSATAPREELSKLRSRVNKMISDEKVDENRLELELALIADKIDITEECVRFHSHNKLFIELLKDDNSQGRKLNFLLQEMNREANTIGAKTSISEVSHIVVQIKDEVEKIREQIQNIE